MSDIPNEIEESRLWQRLSQHSDFPPAIKGLRTITAAVAAKIGELIPEYTDHSVVHMDALWAVTDQVFTESEMLKFSAGEAFILACSFYIHDIGMALAATPEGIKQLEQSGSFKSTFERLTHTGSYEEKEARVIALKIAARELHAENAETFIDSSIPGLDRYLLESKELRDKWGAHIGQVAASHHWSIQEVQRKLGVRGKVPDPIGGEIDLGFLACALRVIDYAHINAARASSLDRILRSSIGAESLKHWNAQEHIAGPRRNGHLLVFGSIRPITDIDGWWTFFEMASGLDREIAAVSDYLSDRRESVDRFSLDGVKGIKTPQSFAALVLPSGFEPVDVRFRPDSMERLISLLGGRTLYGDDFFAPIRELLQNARDAILLYQATAQLHNYTQELGEIRVSVEPTPEGGVLSVSDNGVGMSVRIITNYLLGIAADYWHSPEFFSDYPGITNSGFRPVGRFGIGFLSVFMIGNEVEVQSQRRGGDNLTLILRGVGQRGALVRKQPGLRAGTTVTVNIDREELGNYDNLDKVIRAKAPMVTMPIRVSQQGIITEIRPNWWQTCSQEELLDFIRNQPRNSRTPARETTSPSSHMYSNEEMYYLQYSRARAWEEPISIYKRWSEQQPESITDAFRILAIPDASNVLLCSKGFAVASEPIQGMTGLVEVGEVELNAARSQPLGWDRTTFKSQVINELTPHIKKAINDLSNEQSIPSRHEFLASIGRVYGIDFLIDTELPWLTLIIPPGNGHLVTPNRLKQILREHDELVLLYGENADPWGSARTGNICFPETSKNALMLPISSAGQPDVGSYDDTTGKIIWGTLSEHFSVRHKMDYINATLLVATLRVIEELLNKTLQEIAEMKWARFSRTACLRLLLGKS